MTRGQYLDAQTKFSSVSKHWLTKMCLKKGFYLLQCFNIHPSQNYSYYNLKHGQRKIGKQNDFVE